MVVGVSLDKYTGAMVGEPQVVTHGFVYQSEADELVELVKSEVARAVEMGGSRAEVSARLNQVLARLAQNQTGRQPVIVPIVTKL
jgi:mRNA degradation ribonuclease J1/J2